MTPDETKDVLARLRAVEARAKKPEISRRVKEEVVFIRGAAVQFYRGKRGRWHFRTDGNLTVPRKA